MSFFELADKELDRIREGLNGPEPEKFLEDARDVTDQVLEAAEGMGGGIPGDIDDQLIKKAKEIQEKLAK